MKTVIIPQGSVHTGSLILINHQYAYQEGAMEHSLVAADMPYSVSGNNMDGFVITEWRYKNG